MDSLRRGGLDRLRKRKSFENIPVIDEGRHRLKACEQLKKHIVCFRMGKARFVVNEEGIFTALVGSAFAWRCATGERETCWRKRGVSLVSGIIAASRGPKRVPRKSFLQE